MHFIWELGDGKVKNQKQIQKKKKKKPKKPSTLHNLIFQIGLSNFLGSVLSIYHNFGKA